MKTIYYYQTFVGLHKLMTHLQDIDVINISSIHFDKDKQGNHNIYLNDNLPDDNLFDTMWMETEECYHQGKTILLMVGGAGGAYLNLFNDFSTYYPMLQQLLKSKSFIGGIDLDIEEEVSLENVKMLINRLKYDFGDEFIITMAPIAPSLTHDCPGMSGFIYKELYYSPEGKHIDWFHCQCYDSFSKETYDEIVNNGYPPEKVVMGMESGQFTKETFNIALEEVKQIVKTYPTMGGVYDWEYLNAPPDMNDCSAWCKLMKRYSTM